MKSVLLITIVAVVMIGVMVPSVFAQSTDLNLILDPFPITANEGDLIMFSGILLTADGQYVISDALILIKSDVPYGRDQTIASATTDENGEFFTSWIATSDRINYNLYAVFEGDSVIPEVQSERFTFTVISNDDSLCDQKNFNSRINIDSVPSLAYVGETIEFVGTLSDINGCPLINQKIHLVNPHILRPYPDEIISSKDIVFAITTTDSQGMFVIEWDVTHVVNDLIPELHLVFEGGNGSGSTKKSIDLEILRYNSYITLDPIPNSIDVGESVKFSGNLVLEGDSMEGHVVYIKDEDPFNADDLLATAYVNSDGSYSITWIAEKVDSDGVADIYASFEGTPTHYRTTTCDDGKTSDLGGSCLNTIPLRTIGVTLEPDPTYQPQPSGYKFNGDEYMKLYYALSFNKNPVIAIVPQPDSYDEVKPYFIPIQEGIITWNSGLEKTGGDWNVDFDIIKPGEKFPQRPDVIINVVAYDNDLDCGYTTGVAWVTGEKPLNSKVCATSFGNPADPDDVSATAGHEFIHTVGLGHAFNKGGDVMCSVEHGQPTCPFSFFGKSTIPSDFNLEAVKVMYGKDGWKNPNYIVTQGEKFTVDDFNLEQPIIPTNPINEPDNYEGSFIDSVTAYYKSDESLMIYGSTVSCSDEFGGDSITVKIFNPSEKLISENELSLTNYCSFNDDISLNSKDLIAGEWSVIAEYYDSELKSNFLIYSWDLESSVAPPVTPTPVTPTPVTPTPVTPTPVTPTPVTPTPVTPTPVTPTESDVTVNLNKLSYSTGDIIQVSGTISNPNMNEYIAIEILKPGVGLADVDDYLNLNSQGEFSTSFRTDGINWDKSGTYTIRVTGDSFNEFNKNIIFTKTNSVTPSTEWKTTPELTADVFKTEVYSNKEYYIVNDKITLNGQTPSKITPVKIRIDDPNGNLVKLLQIPDNGNNAFSTSIKIEKLWFTQSGEYTINAWTSSAEPDKDSLKIIIAIPGSEIAQQNEQLEAEQQQAKIAQLEAEQKAQEEKISQLEAEQQQAKIAQLEAEQKAQEEKISQLEAEQNGGGCLIATATYGSELAPQVQQLRELRDNQLLQTASGTQFMGMFNDVYYSFSPIIADYERENPYFKEAVKLAITPMISSLSLMENANSESEVISLGLSVIMLNLGMYLGVPAVVIVGIRRVRLLQSTL